ncbi:MAG: hypothetical protein ACXVHU_08345, partial [Methanobacterium sp.]
EVPMEISEGQKNWILQATLPFGDNFIRMSDSIGELNDASSDRVGIVVEDNADMVKHAFEVLSEEGNVSMPMQETFFSPAYGIVYDKYGVMWNLAAIQENK